MKGFTLIEAVVVLLTLGISAAIFTSVLAEENMAYLFLFQQNQVVQESRSTMHWMVQELRSELLLSAGNSFDTTPNIQTSTNLKFTRNSGGTVTYSWAGGSSPLIRDLDGTSRTLADNVTSFAFTYLDASENVIATPVAPAALLDIASIRINMTIQSGDESTASQTTVSPRNIIP